MSITGVSSVSQTSQGNWLQDLQALSKGGRTASSTSASTTPLAQDMSALGQALQSGDISAAQSAFAKLEQSLQAVQQTHHPHHHHKTHAAQSTGATTSATGTTTSSPGNALNVLA